MNNKVIELTKEKLPKDEWVIGNIDLSIIEADPTYWTTSETREEDIKWFIESLEKTIEKERFTFNKEEESIVFHKGFKEAYFKEAFDRLKEAFSSMTLEEFSDFTTSEQGYQYQANLWNIENDLENIFGLYIREMLDGLEEIRTFDSFVRSMDYEQVYYFGGIIDYQA